MPKKLLSSSPVKKRSNRYSLLSLTATLTVLATNALPVHAFPWQELFLRGIQVIQLSTISDQQEVKIGREIRQELVNSGRVKLSNNRRLNQYINYIGNRLVKASDRQTIPYTFHVVDSDEINAFATMGGFIYVHTGLIKLAENEAELASVIAHEIAHVTSNHSVEQMRQQAVTQGILSAAGLSQAQAVQLGVSLALDLPNSRSDEYEADMIGLQILTKAGYAPGAMVDFMQKLQRKGGGVPSILSTHPGAGERVQALAREIPREKAYSGDGLDKNVYRRILRSVL